MAQEEQDDKKKIIRSSQSGLPPMDMRLGHEKIFGAIFLDFFKWLFRRGKKAD